MISPFVLVPSLSLSYCLFAQACTKILPCPEHLLPQNTGNKKTKHYFNYYGNYTSILHATVSIILSLISILTEGISLGQNNTDLANLIAYNSLAYFLYDTALSEYYRYNSLPMTCHHIASIAATGIIAYLQNSGNETGVFLLLAEISNPFNLVREILKHYKMENSNLFFYISLTFAGLFITTRFIGIPWLLSMVYPGPTALAVKIMAGTIWFVSWHWLFTIINLILKEIKNFLKKSDKQDKYCNLLYGFVSYLRKSQTFLTSFYLTAASLSYGTLYIFHNRYSAQAH